MITTVNRFFGLLVLPNFLFGQCIEESTNSSQPRNGINMVYMLGLFNNHTQIMKPMIILSARKAKFWN